MIYLLKFGASFLSPPGIFIVVFVVMAILLWKKQERNFAKALAGITAVFTYLALRLSVNYCQDHWKAAMNHLAINRGCSDYVRGFSN